jgi:hypothetical protein
MSICSSGLGDPEPLVVKPKVAWKLLGCSNTRGYELLAAGELDSFLDGRSRKITIESIRHYIARRLAPTEDARIEPQTRQRGWPRKSGEAGRGTP